MPTKEGVHGGVWVTSRPHVAVCYTEFLKYAWVYSLRHFNFCANFFPRGPPSSLSMANARPEDDATGLFFMTMYM